MVELSIREFLSIPHQPVTRHITRHINGGNTTSRSREWDYTDARWLEPWDEFCPERLELEFGPLLDLRGPSISHIEDVMDNYRDIHSEAQLVILQHMSIFTRVNRTWEACNNYLSQSQLLPDHLSKLSDRQVISQGLQYGATAPDQVFHLSADGAQLHPNAVGESKLYAKWSYDRWKSSSIADRVDFRQVVSQVNYYMRKRKCRYGIITNELECIAVYRVPGYRGRLKVSRPFPIQTTDSLGHGDGKDMTADVAIFCLPLWARCEVSIDDDDVGEEDANLDEYFPEEPLSSSLPSSPPDFHHPTSEYLPSSE
ncbi:hypothetical protein B7463_g8949, partial [Scytalidium lignicola]